MQDNTTVMCDLSRTIHETNGSYAVAYPDPIQVYFMCIIKTHEIFMIILQYKSTPTSLKIMPLLKFSRILS